MQFFLDRRNGVHTSLGMILATHVTHVMRHVTRSRLGIRRIQQAWTLHLWAEARQ